MSPSKRYAKKHAKARQRRRLRAHERLERDRRQAPRAAEALHQALEDLGLPATLVVESEGRLRSQHQLLGKMIGVMLWPSLAGVPPRRCAVCGAGTSRGPRMLGPCPTLLAKRRGAGAGGGGAHLAPCGAQGPATQSRWQWTWVWDDAVFHKDGALLGVVWEGVERPAQARRSRHDGALTSGGHWRWSRGRPGGLCHATALSGGPGRRAGTNCVGPE